MSFQSHRPKGRHLAAAAGLALVLVSPPAATQGVPEGGQLLDAADAAIADAETRAGLKTLIARGGFSMPGFAEGRFEELYAGEAVRWSIEYPGMGSSTQGTTGSMTWSTDPAMGVMVQSGDEQGGPRRLLQIGSRMVTWRDMYVAAHSLGTVELDGRKHYEVSLEPPRGPSESWFVDAETGLVTRVDVPLPDFQGGHMDNAYEYSDWKRVDGVMLPHKRVQKVGAYELTFTYDEFVVNGEITPEQIAPPEEAREAAAERGTTTPAPSDDPLACSVETLTERPILSIRKTIKATDVGPTLAVLLPEVMAHVSRSGVSPAGPPFSRYHAMTEDEIDIEAGMPITRAVEGAGRVKASTLPAGKAAITWHIGDFHELPTSYARLEEWMARKELVARGAFWEVYWTDPGLEPDQTKWRTQILWPVE